MGGISAPRLGMRNLMQGYMGASADDVANDSPTSIGHLVENTRAAVDASGMGVKAPTMEAPEVPDLGIQRQARSNLSLTKMVQGFTGTIPVTSYGAKLGHHAGMAMNSPSDQAAREAATAGWADEQARIKNANTLHAFNNQYSKMKTDADNQTTQRSLDLAQMQMIAAGSKGYFGKVFEGADKDRDLKAKDIEARRAMAQANLGFKSRAAERGEEQLALAKTRGAQATEKHTLDMAKVPDTAMAIVGHGDAADESLRRLQELVRTEPDAMKLLNKTLTWHDVALSADPLARRIHMLRSEAMENLTQFQRRRTNQEGSSYLSHVLTMFGDQGDPATVLEGTDLLRGRLYNMIKMEEGAHPQLKHRPGMPTDTSGKPGAPNIDDVMKRAGIQ